MRIYSLSTFLKVNISNNMYYNIGCHDFVQSFKNNLTFLYCDTIVALINFAIYLEAHYVALPIHATN